MNIFLQTIDGLQEILAVCPCCGDIFRLVEGKFLFPQRPTKTCEYLQVVGLESRVANEDERIGAAEERFAEKLQAQQQALIELGRKRAKKKLKKIDPVFSGRDIDPQDVKVIFDPVEYVIFHGLNSSDGVDLVEFVSRSPDSRAHEVVVKSIEKTIQNGDVEFETLHMKDDGSFDVRKA